MLGCWSWYRQNGSKITRLPLENRIFVIIQPRYDDLMLFVNVIVEDGRRGYGWIRCVLLSQTGIITSRLMDKVIKHNLFIVIGREQSCQEIYVDMWNR